MVRKGTLQPKPLTFAEIFDSRLGIANGRHELANSQASVDVAQLELYLPPVCECARQYMQRLAQERAATLEPQLQRQLERLEELQARHEAQAHLMAEDDARSRSKKEQLQTYTRNLFTNYRQWIDETLRVEAEKPSLRVVAVLAGCR